MKKAITVILTVMCTVCIGIAVSACSSGENVYDDVYRAEYGKWFTLPVSDGVSVTNKNGEYAEIFGNKIFIDETDGYTVNFSYGGKSYQSKIEVVNEHSPDIFVSQKFCYGAINSEVGLVDARATDGVRELAVQGTMFFDGKEYDVSDGFVPEEVGTYKYVLTATGANGKTAEKTVDYYIEESKDDYSRKISSFDKPYGLNEVAYMNGKADYSTDMAFENENGSLRINLASMPPLGETVVSTGTKSNALEFLLVNLTDPNVAQYDAFYFYAYNDSKESVRFWFNWQKSYVLQPKRWTRIELLQTEYASALLSSAYDKIFDSVTLNDINGLNVNIEHDSDGYLLRDDSVYLSSIRGLNVKSAEEIGAMIDDALVSGAEIGRRDADDLQWYYNCLSENDKAEVDNFADFKDAILKKELSDAGITPQAGKLMYFDNAIAEEQIVTVWGVKSIGVNGNKQYGGKNTLEIVTDSVGDFAITFQKSYIYNLSGYDAVELIVYNGASEDVLLYNSDVNYKNIGVASDYILEPGWNRVAIALGNAKDIDGSVFWIRKPQWGDVISAGTEFYIAPVYARTFSELVSLFDSDENLFDDYAFCESILSTYSAMPENKKSAEVKQQYEEFVAQYEQHNQPHPSTDGKTYISFLGDSISTYSGYSNNTDYNRTIGNNAVWYPNGDFTGANMPVTATWWHKVLTELNYELCVNNSYSGSVVQDENTYNFRAGNLHNNDKIAPDIIVIYIGINDFHYSNYNKNGIGNYDGKDVPPATPTNFSEAYGKMLYNIQTKYSEAKIYCCTLLPDHKYEPDGINTNGDSLANYNNAIKTIATNMNVEIVDLYSYSGLTDDNIKDNTLDGLHPTTQGMQKIAECVKNAISKNQEISSEEF